MTLEHSAFLFRVPKLPIFYVLQDWIMEQWENNYYISAIAGATNGSSLVVMSKGLLNLLFCRMVIIYYIYLERSIHIQVFVLLLLPKILLAFPVNGRELTVLSIY